MSVNDLGQPASDVRAAVSWYLRSLRRALPEAWVIVQGVAAGSTGPSAAAFAQERAVAAAVEELSDPMVAWIPVTTAAGGPWFYGTGYANDPNGSGNTDVYIGAVGSGDSTHPSRAGASYLARRLETEIDKIINRWSAFL
jgi:lysophospholipase L1-like esterase